MNRAALLGLTIMMVSEGATLARIEPFWSWNTPIAWTGFIVFADSVVWQARGNSWIRSSPREFLLLSALSVPLWLVFEFYNRFIQNWYYVGLPKNPAVRYFGYIWSFSTIWPAVFEAAELIAIGRSGATGQPGRPERKTRHALHPALLVVCASAGALMLALPFVAPPSAVSYLAAPVWLGFILLLDPINARLGEASLLSDLKSGAHDRIKNLLLGGLLCGVLWEFWNYWSRAKWHYTVPIMERVKLFEMPVPGYLGFPAFALECFTMYTFIRAVARLRGRPIGF